MTVGDGSNILYGPDFIVEQDVVLVTTNYRLGPFGFANFDRHGYTGNNGFKDQRLALKWVRKNIKHFGGNPHSITLMGQSAGKFAIIFATSFAILDFGRFFLEKKKIINTTYILKNYF